MADTVDTADETHREKEEQWRKKPSRTLARATNRVPAEPWRQGKEGGALLAATCRPNERTNDSRDARATRNLERSYATTLRERAHEGKVRDGSPQKLTRPIQHGGLARR